MRALSPVSRAAGGGNLTHPFDVGLRVEGQQFVYGSHPRRQEHGVLGEATGLQQ